MPEAVCINGVPAALEDARVSVFDSGFTQGIGLFETMRAYGRHVFRLDRHIDRLRGSAQRLGWSIVPDAAELRRGVFQVVAAVGGDDARVRVTVTTGSLRDAGDAAPRLTIVCTASPGGRYSSEFYERGVTLTLCQRYRQSEFDPTVGHKTTSYFARMAALREAYALRAFESVWFNLDDRVAEGSISSIFIVAGGTLLTPPLSTPVLRGITREAVIELARGAGVAFEEREITVEELFAADEVFLTNSMMELMPVARIDRESVGSEKPGPVWRALAEAYGDLVERERDGD